MLLNKSIGGERVVEEGEVRTGTETILCVEITRGSDVCENRWLISP